MRMTKTARNTMKPPPLTQSSSVNGRVFEGVYTNARMLHFLTAVVGSTCDVRVKNGAVYEGIFKTLSSQCELAVDAVHKLIDGDGGGVGAGGEGGGVGRDLSSAPKIEDITETMIFGPNDLVTMTCRNVNLNFAVRDAFTDLAISSLRVNGVHGEKVLQKWDADGHGEENFELESDTSNGWDANEMFRFNEEAYGIRSTYDSSLSMYTMPLDRGSSEDFQRREIRAARLASEIEGSLQYRQQVSLENDEGRSEEDKYSSVVRERANRAVPGFSSVSRDGKYIPRGGMVSLTGGSVRVGASGRTFRHPPSSTSPPKLFSDSSSLLSLRASSSSNQPQSSPTSTDSPSCANHVLPHSFSHPQEQTDAICISINGVALRTPPKSPQLQNSRNLRNQNCRSSAASRALKIDACPQNLPSAAPAYPGLTSSTVSTIIKPSCLTPLFPVDVNKIIGSAAQEHAENLSSAQDGRSSKAMLVQQRSQLEELRKFGKEFRLQTNSSTSAISAPPPSSCSTGLAPSTQDLLRTSEAAPSSATASAMTFSALGSGDDPCSKSNGLTEAESVAAILNTQLKNSTLNPNAKEFLPIKGNPAMQKPVYTLTTPGPNPPSPSVVLPPPGQQGGSGIYSSPSGHYLSYMSPIPIQGHSIQAPSMYQYIMSTVGQGKYPILKGPVVGPRPDHHTCPSSPLISAPASAAGPSLVASPFPLSYLQYGQVIQAMPPHYNGQTVYSMLQGGARVLTPGAVHQPMDPGPQYPGQAESPLGSHQAMYAPQPFPHHSGSIHPQSSSTPTGIQAQTQPTAPSPGHCHPIQGGLQSPPIFHHSGGLSAPTPNLLPGHTSPQASYTMQGYSFPGHQALPHGFPSISQLTQAHVSGSISGPHHSASHAPPTPIMLHYTHSQQGNGSNLQHGAPPQQGGPQHFYIGTNQGVHVQAHPTQQLSFHPSAN